MYSAAPRLTARHQVTTSADAAAGARVLRAVGGSQLRTCSGWTNDELDAQIVARGRPRNEQREHVDNSESGQCCSCAEEVMPAGARQAQRQPTEIMHPANVRAGRSSSSICQRHVSVDHGVDESDESTRTRILGGMMGTEGACELTSQGQNRRKRGDTATGGTVDNLKHIRDEEELAHDDARKVGGFP